MHTFGVARNVRLSARALAVYAVGAFACEIVCLRYFFHAGWLVAVIQAGFALFVSIRLSVRRRRLNRPPISLKARWPVERLSPAGWTGVSLVLGGGSAFYFASDKPG